MMRHIWFIILLFMLLGYITLEFARFRRSSKLLSYPRSRLILRSISGIVLTSLAFFLFYWRTLGLDPNFGTILVFSLMFLLFGVVFTDFRLVFYQYKRERDRKKEEFMNEMSRIMEQRSDPAASRGDENNS